MIAKKVFKELQRTDYTQFQEIFEITNSRNYSSLKFIAKLYNWFACKASQHSFIKTLEQLCEVSLSKVFILPLHYLLAFEASARWKTQILLQDAHCFIIFQYCLRPHAKSKETVLPH